MLSSRRAAPRRPWCGRAQGSDAVCCLSCSRYHDQVSYRWSMLSVSVSFTHTIKTLGPMFTVLFSRLLLSERMPCSRLLSVLPVVLGVAITTSTEVEFALVPPTHTHHPRRAWLRQRGVARHRWASTRSTAALPTAQPSPVPSSPAQPVPQPSRQLAPGQVGFCCAVSSTVCQVRIPDRQPDPPSRSDASAPTTPRRYSRCSRSKLWPTAGSPSRSSSVLPRSTHYYCSCRCLSSLRPGDSPGQPPSGALVYL